MSLSWQSFVYRLTIRDIERTLTLCNKTYTKFWSHTAEKKPYICQSFTLRGDFEVCLLLKKWSEIRRICFGKTSTPAKIATQWTSWFSFKIRVIRHHGGFIRSVGRQSAGNAGKGTTVHLTWWSSLIVLYFTVKSAESLWIRCFFCPFLPQRYIQRIQPHSHFWSRCAQIALKCAHF